MRRTVYSSSSSGSGSTTTKSPARRADSGPARAAKGLRMSTVATQELVRRIWARDASLWTGTDEADWLGWLDEPMRMQAHVDELLDVATRADYDDVVLLGMGGSS